MGCSLLAFIEKSRVIWYLLATFCFYFIVFLFVFY